MISFILTTSLPALSLSTAVLISCANKPVPVKQPAKPKKEEPKATSKTKSIQKAEKTEEHLPPMQSTKTQTKSTQNSEDTPNNNNVEVKKAKGSKELVRKRKSKEHIHEEAPVAEIKRARSKERANRQLKKVKSKAKTPNEDDDDYENITQLEDICSNERKPLIRMIKTPNGGFKEESTGVKS